MAVCRLRLTLGQYELEAEGPQEYVEKQREIFLAKVDAVHGTSEPASEKARSGEERAQHELDLGHGNTVVAPSSNLHASWKI